MWSYDVGSLHLKNTRVASCGLQWRNLVRLFRKPKSKFYWYDFTMRGHRYRGSTQETKSARGVTVASLRLAAMMEGADPLPNKPAALTEFSPRFLASLDWARLEDNDK